VAGSGPPGPPEPPAQQHGNRDADHPKQYDQGHNGRIRQEWGGLLGHGSSIEWSNNRVEAA
jgi:hypothetical protein